MKRFYAASILLTILLSLWITTSSAAPVTPRPSVSIQEALRLVDSYVKKEHPDLAQRFIVSAELRNDHQNKNYWLIQYASETYVKPGALYVSVYMDRSIKEGAAE